MRITKANHLFFSEKEEEFGYTVHMKLLLTAIIIIFTLFGCSDSNPVKENYLGVYRIIKIDDNSEIITTVLNQIELTDEYYIYRIDKNGDNRFSSNEIVKRSYDFLVDGAGEPYILLAGDPDKIYMLPDNYYDLLFKKEGEKNTTLYTKLARIFMEPSQKNILGEYRVIKFRENGKILNIGNLARIIITEDQYISEMDLDGNGRLGSDEIISVAYTYVKNENNETLLKINNSHVPVWLREEPTFDLILVKVDDWGNEIIMYLKQ